MQNFKIAVAQVPSEKGNVEKNIQRHIDAIDSARKEKVTLIVFPELSLTGYEPELANTLAFSVDDVRLTKLLAAAIENRIWVVAGAPLKSGKSLDIGAVIISPEGFISTYSKMNFHSGEDQFFSESSEQKILEIQSHKVALAICADTNNPDHVKAYVENGATIYVAGSLITESGYTADTENLSSYAREHKILVTMANHNCPTGSWNPVGKSAAWSKDGLLAVASKTKNSLVISQLVNELWVSEAIEM